MDCELSVVMPAYREAESLRTLLPVLVPVVAALTASNEIIVADAMTSVDDTAEVCAANGVTCIARTGGNLYGDAVAGSSHASVSEVPVTFEQRKAGESKRDLPAFMLSYFTSMAKMRSFRNEELAKAKAVTNDRSR